MKLYSMIRVKRKEKTSESEKMRQCWLSEGACLYREAQCVGKILENTKIGINPHPQGMGKMNKYCTPKMILNFSFLKLPSNSESFVCFHPHRNSKSDPTH